MTVNQVNQGQLPRPLRFPSAYVSTLLHHFHALAAERHNWHAKKMQEPAGRPACTHGGHGCCRLLGRRGGGGCTADGRAREGGSSEWRLYRWLHWRRSRVSRTWRIAPQGVTPHSPSSHILGSNPADVTDWEVEPVQPPAQLPHCCVPHPHTTQHHTTAHHTTINTTRPRQQQAAAFAVVSEGACGSECEARAEGTKHTGRVQAWRPKSQASCMSCQSGSGLAVMRQLCNQGSRALCTQARPGPQSAARRRVQHSASR
jgi:hypothetical protein